jgi:hypothetical protein
MLNNYFIVIYISVVIAVQKSLLLVFVKMLCVFVFLPLMVLPCFVVSRMS